MQGAKDDNQIPLKDAQETADKSVVQDVEQNAGASTNGNNNRRNSK